MVDWSAIAAWGALSLSIGNAIYNIRKETNKPKKERQQALRDQLRAVLVEAQTETRAALNVLKAGDVPSGPTPGVLEHFRERIDRVIQGGLTCPGPHSVRSVSIAALPMSTYWASAQRADRRLSQSAETGTSIEEAAKRRSYEQLDLLTFLTNFLNGVDEMIDGLNKIDDGDRKAIRKYQF